MEYFNNLEPLLKTFWFIALPASIIFLIQTVMTFMGTDSHDGTDADFSGHLSHGDAPFQLFSLRNLINFLLGVGWTGISFYSTIQNPVSLTILSMVVGIVFVSMYFVIMRQMLRFGEDNSFKMSSVLNKTAEVYLAIPENKQGKGKVMLSINGSVRELDAITEHSSKIATGSVVSIIKIEGESLLVVKPV
jgi:hypothetical protein